MNPEKRFFSRNDPIITNSKNNIRSHARIFVGPDVTKLEYTCSLAYLPKPGLEHISFFAIFDGHYSPVISKYLAKELLNSILDADKVLFDTLAHKSSAQTPLTIEQGKDFKNAIKKGFLNIDQKMRNLPEIKDKSELESGSAALACFITPNNIIIANCGDSRAPCMDNEYEIFKATKQHKPDNLEDRVRIEDEGGIVEYGDKDDLLLIKPPKGYPCVSMARSFGDYLLKTNQEKAPFKQLISPEPDVYVLPRSQKDRFLILANARVWDLIEDEEMKALIHDNLDLDLSGVTNDILTECCRQVRIFEKCLLLA